MSDRPIDALSLSAFEGAANALMEATAALCGGDADKGVLISDVEAWIGEHRPNADMAAIKIMVADFLNWLDEARAE